MLIILSLSLDQCQSQTQHLFSYPVNLIASVVPFQGDRAKGKFDIADTIAQEFFQVCTWITFSCAFAIREAHFNCQSGQYFGICAHKASDPSHHAHIKVQLDDNFLAASDLLMGEYAENCLVPFLHAHQETRLEVTNNMLRLPILSGEGHRRIVWKTQAGFPLFLI